MWCLRDSQLLGGKHGELRSLVCGNDRHPVRRAPRPTPPSNPFAGQQQPLQPSLLRPRLQHAYQPDRQRSYPKPRFGGSNSTRPTRISASVVRLARARRTPASRLMPADGHVSPEVDAADIGETYRQPTLTVQKSW